MFTRILLYINILLLWQAAISTIFAANTDSLRRELDYVMKNKAVFSKEKDEKIQNLKQLLQIGRLQELQEYDINQKLYHEYEKYAIDSALIYINKNIKLANQLNDNNKTIESQLQLASTYSTKGMHIESSRLLQSIGAQQLDNELKARYYEVYTIFLSHYGQSTGNYSYYQKSSTYRDSLLMLLPAESLHYKIEHLIKLVYGSSDERAIAERQAVSLLKILDDTHAERAVIAFLLSEVYKQQKDDLQQEYYLMISAIADVKNSIKDNASLQSLALVYYRQNNIRQAYHFMQEAVNDAVFCNVRYRTMEAATTYPIINSLFIEKEKQQKAHLQIYLVLISILSVILIVSIIFVYLQVKKLGRIRRELFHSNQELNRLNDDLQSAITSLREANLIKEEYITHFFDRCSNYIDKLGEYKRMLAKLASTSHLEELFKQIKSNTIIEEEVEELYRTFDTIFLNLYPTFVDEFNELLIPGEQLMPKHGEQLNTELRIFALIRLGINDSVKIASFLRYSLRTVYNYRTKIRNKAAGKREDFDGLVELIGRK